MLSSTLIILSGGKGSKNMQEKKVPLCEKYTLSINEAAEYFRIGQKRLRRLVAENPDADYVLMIGNRIQIKRKKFEAFVDEATVV